MDLKNSPVSKKTTVTGESATSVWHPGPRRGLWRPEGSGWSRTVSRKPGSPATALVAAPSPGLWGVHAPILGRGCWQQHIGSPWDPETQDNDQFLQGMSLPGSLGLKAVWRGGVVSRSTLGLMNSFLHKDPWVSLLWEGKGARASLVQFLRGEARILTGLVV